MGGGRARRARRWGSILVLTGMLLATSLSGVAFAAGADLSQCSNGKVGDPREACSWQNGNLNKNNSQYAEGDGVGFRSVLTSLEVGDQYVFTVGWDTIEGTAIAYDYLVSWNHTETGDPADGTAYATDPPDSLHAIPVDPRVANEGVTQEAGDIAAWGATLDGVGNYQYQSGTASDPLPMSTMETTVDITFTANATTAVISWGGHIGTRADWNPGRTTAAGTVQGSPYHMRLTNLYNVTDDDTERLGNLDRSLDADLILQSAELSIAKTASTASVPVGGSLSYTITVTNNGDGDATNVVVTDTVDAAFTVTDVTPSQGSCDPPSNSVNCALGTVASGGGSATVTVNVSVPSTPDSCQVVGNVASVDDDVLDAPLDSEPVDVTITGCAVELSLVKSNDTGGEAAPGESFDWTLTATNDGAATATATGVQVTDTIPAGLTVTNVAPDTGVDCSASSGNDIDCTIETLAPGDSADVVVTVSVPEIDACGSYPNTGTLLDDQQTLDTDDDTVDVTGCAPDLSLVKSNDTGGEAALGESFDWTLTASNDGAATATASHVQVTDTIPAGLTVTNVAPDAGVDCSASSGNDIDCTIETLAPGDSADVVVTVSVPEIDACGSYPNTGTLLDDQQTIDTDDDTVTITDVQAECAPDVGVTKDASSADVGLGGSVTYTLVATNAPGATATANNVAITDVVPDPLMVTGVVSGDADCSASVGNLVSCDAGSLAPGESATVTVAVVAPSDGAVCNPWTNLADVSVEGQLVDSDSADVTVVGCEPAIQVVKTADAAQAQYDPFDDDDETITYAYEITNIGTVSLTDITLLDDVLGQLLEIGDGVTLAPGESTTVMAQHVLTDADASAGQVVNVATATGTDPIQQIVSDSDVEVIEVVEVVRGVLGDPPTTPQADPEPDPPTLPQTGGEVVPLFGVSNILMALGAAAVRLARRAGDRPTRSTRSSTGRSVVPNAPHARRQG